MLQTSCQKARTKGTGAERSTQNTAAPVQDQHPSYCLCMSHFGQGNTFVRPSPLAWCLIAAGPKEIKAPALCVFQWIPVSCCALQCAVRRCALLCWVSGVALFREAQPLGKVDHLWLVASSLLLLEPHTSRQRPGLGAVQPKGPSIRIGDGLAISELV